MVTPTYIEADSKNIHSFPFNSITDPEKHPQDNPLKIDVDFPSKIAKSLSLTDEKTIFDRLPPQETSPSLTTS